MRILSLALQFEGTRDFKPMFIPVHGMRSRLGTGVVCDCGDLHCEQPGLHARHASLAPRAAIHLNQWDAAFPHANLGVLTGLGGPTGVVVIRVRHPQGLADLQERLGTLPATVTSVAPDGTSSLWFTWNNKVDAPTYALGTGVDLLAGGSWEMVPGSVSPAGLYIWGPVGSPSQVAFAPLPAAWRKAGTTVMPNSRVYSR